MSETTVPTDNVWRDGAVAGAMAGVINVLIWTVGNAAGLDFIVEVGGDSQHVTMSQPFLASFFGALIATLLLWTLMKGNQQHLWKRIILTLGAISLISPLTAATDLASGIFLAMMHVVVLTMLVIRAAPAPTPKTR